MNNDVLYFTTMNMLKSLWKEGVIDENDYKEMDTIFSQKYGKSLSSVLTDIDLISLEGRGNMGA